MGTIKFENFLQKILKDSRLTPAEIKELYKAKVAARPTESLADKGQALKLTTTLNLPKGYTENFFTWDRKEDVLLVVFIATNDPLGISIEGMKKGDVISIESVAGLASFSTEYDWGNILGASITAVLGAGLQIVDKTWTNGVFSSIIKRGENFMEEQFKDKKKPGKVRDAFGIDPGSQHKARQEGGVLICLPGNVGASYSGSDEKAWIKKPGDRYDKARPPQINDGFFIMRDRPHNTRYIRSDKGQVVILAWDHKFHDNIGYYKMAVRLEKGNGSVPDAEDPDA